MAAVINVQQMPASTNLIYDAQGNLIGIQNPHGGGADMRLDLVSGAGTPILNGASAGQDSGWVAYTPGMRLAYALDSGSTSTNFSVDISADGSTSLGQAFTGTWAATTAEISPPIWLTNTQARFIRFNVLTGGPLSVIRF